MSVYDDIFGTGEKLLMDPVHGGLTLYAHELTVIDSPLFQRLRFVKQNDVASLIFPGAMHTRFQHSLGVMHLAGKVYRSVLMNHLRHTAQTRVKAISVEVAESIRYFYHCFRLAALLHDTGHFPFSHEFENSRRAEKLLKSEEARDFVSVEGLDISEGALSHEDYSVRCAFHLLKEASGKNNLPVSMADVLTLMEKSKFKPSDTFGRHAKNLISVLLRNPENHQGLLEQKATETVVKFLSSLISGELDVDKMDYLLRDSYFTGVSYGFYNSDHLINTLRIGVSLEPWWVGVSILDKGRGALEDFIFSRFQLYSNVWSHKGVVAGKLLLSKAIDEVLCDETVEAHVKSSLTDIENFTYFTEDFFWELFRKKAKERNDSFSARLLQRKLPRHVLTLESPSDFEVQQRVAEFRGKSENIVHYKTHIKFSKIRQQSFDAMKVLIRKKLEGGGDSHRLVEIRSFSSFFEKFEDTSRVHFYII